MSVYNIAYRLFFRVKSKEKVTVEMARLSALLAIEIPDFITERNKEFYETEFSILLNSNTAGDAVLKTLLLNDRIGIEWHIRPVNIHDNAFSFEGVRSEETCSFRLSSIHWAWFELTGPYHSPA